MRDSYRASRDAIFHLTHLFVLTVQREIIQSYLTFVNVLILLLIHFRKILPLKPWDIPVGATIPINMTLLQWLLTLEIDTVASSSDSHGTFGSIWNYVTTSGSLKHFSFRYYGEGKDLFNLSFYLNAQKT